MTYCKKLIEVALPLEVINRESVREKSIRHGHPSTMHLWWARRPLATCRAVLFSALVDDPSSHPEIFPTEDKQRKERKRLFQIIEELVNWDNIQNETVLNAARNEISKSVNDPNLIIFDPFCGGGSIPLEAQRLGLISFASDLNPIAVLLTKALIDIPTKFANKPPVNPKANTDLINSNWIGVTGLAEDVRYYGEWMKMKAWERIGKLYPKIASPASNNRELTCVAWIWTRAVKCPNPACNKLIPLVKTFILSDKKNKAWAEPIYDQNTPEPKFLVKTSGVFPTKGTVNRKGVTCVACNTPIPFTYVREEGKAGRMSTLLMAIVAQQDNGFVFLSPNAEQVALAMTAIPTWEPTPDLPFNPRDFKTPNYGFGSYASLFTKRQLLALDTFSDLVPEARQLVYENAISNYKQNHKSTIEGELGYAEAYADAVATYLGFSVDRCANYWSSFTPWGGSFIVQTFGRQAIPMVWDFAEANPFSTSTGNWLGAIEWITKCLETSVPAYGKGTAIQADAMKPFDTLSNAVVFTDPPYYDNIDYANLSDYFYIWLRRSIGRLYPALFGTVLTPKDDELVALPYRFENDSEMARHFFENGLIKVFSNIYSIQNSNFPLLIYYAFKQSETGDDSEDNAIDKTIRISTGWETMLEGLLKSNFLITGTWPLRTERDQGLKTGSNFLASSIVLVCRKKEKNAAIATRREFLSTLKTDLPLALKKLQEENIAPVDFAQSAIGPGMSIFSQYSRVLEADGSTMTVRTALHIINQELDSYLAQQEGDMDRDTRFCLAWFEQYGMNDGPFGEAEVLTKAKDISLRSIVDDEIACSKSGKVRLLQRAELDKNWDPVKNKRLTVWECTQHLIRILADEGEAAAGKLIAKLGGGQSEAARALAYRLYSICEKKKWAEEARAYNSLVMAWPEIIKLAQKGAGETKQGGMNI